MRKFGLLGVFLLVGFFCFSPVSFAAFQVGETGMEIAQMQEKLMLEGYDIGFANGIFNEQTEHAVRAFQAEHGLPVTGVVTRETYQKIMGVDLSYIDVKKRRRIVGAHPRFSQLAEVALSYIGVPYVFGGTTPLGFDCSGFTQFCYARVGIAIPRGADLQYYHLPKVRAMDLMPGDLVFFETYEYGPSHCGIYLGDEKFVHAGTSTGVTVASLKDVYWSSKYIGASRVVE